MPRLACVRVGGNYCGLSRLARAPAKHVLLAQTLRHLCVRLLVPKLFHDPIWVLTQVSRYPTSSKFSMNPVQPLCMGHQPNDSVLCFLYIALCMVDSFQFPHIKMGSCLSSDLCMCRSQVLSMYGICMIYHRGR